jgi:hypothetical protein
MGRGHIAPRISKLGSFILRPLYPLKKEPLVPIGLGGWGVEGEPVWTLWTRERCHASAGNRTLFLVQINSGMVKIDELSLLHASPSVLFTPLQFYSRQIEVLWYVMKN